MARIRSRKAQKQLTRHHTPPLDLTDYEGQAKTPQRSAVFALRAFAQQRGIKITREDIHKVCGVPTRNQSRILASKQLRTHYNQPNSGPDNRGRKRALKQSETAAIGAYCNDESIPLDNRGAPWPTIARDTSVPLPLIYHSKTDSNEPLNSDTIRLSCREDEGLINAVYEEEKELGSPQARNRREFVDERLEKRPHSKNFFDVCFYDEFHLGISPQVTKRVKRKLGKESREARMNVHLKKVTSKDTKAKAREEEALPLLNIFVIISKGYRRFIPYKVPSNKVGKISTKVYTQEILPAIKQDLLDHSLTLW